MPSQFSELFIKKEMFRFYLLTDLRSLLTYLCVQNIDWMCIESGVTRRLTVLNNLISTNLQESVICFSYLNCVSLLPVQVGAVPVS